MTMMTPYDVIGWERVKEEDEDEESDMEEESTDTDMEN